MKYSYLGGLIKTNVSAGFSTVFGYGLAVLSALVAIIGEAGDVLLPLGVTPAQLMVTSAVLVVAVTVGRAIQAITKDAPVNWGLASILTFGATIVTTAQLVLGDLVDKLFLLGVPASTQEKIVAVLATALIIIRQLQAAFGQGGDVVLPETADTV
jgi:Ni/Fe-hydrogenase subunit HybB-like protein